MPKLSRARNAPKGKNPTNRAKVQNSFRSNSSSFGRGLINYTLSPSVPRPFAKTQLLKRRYDSRIMTVTVNTTSNNQQDSGMNVSQSRFSSCLYIPILISGGLDTITNQGYTWPDPTGGDHAVMAGVFDSFRVVKAIVTIIPSINMSQLQGQIAQDIIGSRTGAILCHDVNTINNAFTFSGQKSGENYLTVAQSVQNTQTANNYSWKKKGTNLQKLSLAFEPNTLVATTFPGYPTSGYSGSSTVMHAWYNAGSAQQPAYSGAVYVVDLGASSSASGDAIYTYDVELVLFVEYTQPR